MCGSIHSGAGVSPTAGHRRRPGRAASAILFIGVKTVEANLTRIHRKLGLRGRVNLARDHSR